jgi:hypothetical protein
MRNKLFKIVLFSILIIIMFVFAVNLLLKPVSKTIEIETKTTSE